MKVKDLIADLQRLNPEFDVSISVYGGCGGYEDTYQIFDTDEYPADKHGPGSAFVCVDKGCMCHAGTRTSKLTNRPQSVSSYWRGLEAAGKEAQELLDHSNKWAKHIGEPKTYKEQLELDRYKSQARISEIMLEKIARLQRNSEPKEEV